MGKMINYMVLLSFILILFHGAGLLEEGGVSTLLRFLLHPSLFSVTSFSGIITAAFLSIGIGVTVAFFIARQPELAIKVGMATFLLEVGWDLIIIFNILKELNTFFATAIISPLILTYAFTVFEWWVGRD